ncbi:MAG: hypothetical protein GXO69_07510 [Acidobacteria bacterium]|nr:hypothetical protein [Acidobacteriota bacterium]
MMPKLYAVLSILTFPFLKKKLRKRFGDSYIRERMWRVPAAEGRFDYLIHGASVGEQNVAAQVVAALSQKGFRVLLTAATDTGLAQAEKHHGNNENVVISYLPFDLPGPVKRFFKAVQADRLVLVETELWPRLILSAKAAGAEVILINGRISDSAFRNYMRFSRFLKETLDAIDICVVRYPVDGDRFQALGVTPERILQCGNLKLSSWPEVSPVPIETGDCPVMVFGSTREGEEEMILDKMSGAMKKGRPIPVFAPRHVERADEVEKLLVDTGFEVVRSKGIESFGLNPGQALLVNETGRLMSFYAACDVCFVGGSLVAKGGQNFVEPFFFAKPVITGNNLSNFLDVLPVFEPFMTIVESPGELAFAVEAFWSAREEFERKAAEGRRILEREKNALPCVMEALT